MAKPAKKLEAVARAIPEGYHTITTYLMLKDASRAIDFYKRAFGAVELGRMPGPDGTGVMHAELQIGDSRLFLGDEHPEMGCKSPETLGATTVSLYLYVQDADAAIDRAVKAGGTVKKPPMDMFWGDRYGVVADPFGYDWSLATHIRDLTPDEIRKGAEEFFRQQRPGG